MGTDDQGLMGGAKGLDHPSPLGSVHALYTVTHILGDSPSKRMYITHAPT